MKKEWEPRQSRASTHFKFFSEKYLWGSTRSELAPDERGVWIDFLCLGSMNFGVIEVFSRDQLANQLMISRELLDRSIDKFTKFGKIKRKYSKREKKEIFCIVKWSHFQAYYLTKRLKKSDSSDKIERIEKTEKSDTENEPILQERKGEEIKLNKTISEDIKENDSENPKSPNSNLPKLSSPLPSNSNSFSEKGLTKKDEFLSMLREYKGYLFSEVQDSLLFDITVTECPNISILKQTAKKIAWWKEHPDALKANPRKQLQDWFKEEQKLQERGGPQQVGKIMKEVADPDHRRFFKQLLDPKSRKRNGKEER